MTRSYFTLGSILTVFAAAGLQAQTLSVDKTTLAFSAQAGGAPVSQTINVTSSGGAVSFFAFNNSVSWLKVNSATSATGTTPSALTVTADPTGLQPSIYTGTLSIGVIGGTTSIPVTVTFTVGNVSVSPASVAFTYQMGGTSPQSTTVNISSAQPTAISLSATTTSGGSWLAASLTGGTATTGTSPNTAIISVNQTVLQTLAAGTYNGTVTITPTSGTSTTPATVSVTLTVSPAPPVTVSPGAIALGYQIGGTNNSPQQALTLATTGAQGVAYGLATGVSPNPSGRIWFTVNPSGGTIPANGNTQVTVAYDTTANLPAGTYTGTITLQTPGGTPAQQTINVTLVVSTSPLVNVANAALTFNYQVGTAAPASQNVTVSSTGTQLPLTITYTPQNSWLSAPATGVTGTAFAVSVSPTGLQPGTYSGTINITASGAANGPLAISVSLVVANNPVIVVTTNGCSTAVNQSCPMLFANQIGQTAPGAQNISITSSTGAALNYTVSAVSSSCNGAWLLPGGALTTSGTTSATVPIIVNAGGVAAGSVCNQNLSIAATIASTGVAAPNSPLTIPVTMYVSSSDLLVANPYALTFTAPELGQSPAAQTISLTSTGSNALNYTVAPTISTGSNWLFVNQVSGSTASGFSQLAVQVAPGLLSPGTYFGSIAITATGPGGAAVADATTANPLIVQVTFQVTAGNMSVSPTTLSFTQTAAGSAPAAQTISISSSLQALTYNVTAAVTTTSGSVNWLTATPASGTTPGSVSVSVDGSKLPAGVYNGAVTITATTPATGGSPATIPVTLTVLAGTISATPTSLTFAQVAGGPAPATQAVTVTVSCAPCALSVAISTSTDSNGAAVNWLSATPTTGSAPATVTVAANAGSLPVGTYTGKVTITAASPGANGSPITIPVTLNVVAGQTLSVTPATLNFSYSVGATAPAAQTVQVAATGVAAPFSTAIATTPTGGAWLAVSPTSGSTPATLSVTVSPTGLAAGNYTGAITISSTSSLNPVTVTVNLAVSAIPTPVITAIGNAASYATGGVSPGENIVIFGTGIGPATLTGGTLTSSGAFSTTAGNTQVTFDGTPAPVIYASSTQTSVMVPYGVSGRTVTTIRISYQGVLSNPLIYNVATVAPGIYTQNSSGTGPGAILNQDYSINGPTKPAAKGSVVAVYMTGEGTTNPVPLDGAIAPVNGAGLYKPLLPVTATVGGVPATVQYYGTSPGIVYGVMQVNLTIPANVGTGAQSIVITVGSNNTQTGVTVAVQ